VVQLPSVQLGCEISRWLACVVAQLPFRLAQPSVNYRCDTKICAPSNPKVTHVFDHPVSGDCAFNNLMVLFDFFMKVRLLRYLFFVGDFLSTLRF
jgi:hypothetical protein